ncbi:MAG: hypothetical protein ACRDTA_24800 [Pseudonocardiaceae bacterium]
MSELRQQLQDRLEVLRREREIGQDRLRELERESLAVQQTVLRISGAIQVLEEVLGPEQTPAAQPPVAEPATPQEDRAGG